MSEEVKESLGIRVRDTLVEIMNTDILKGLEDIISKSEFIKGYSKDPIETIKMSDNGMYLRHTSAHQHFNGGIWTIQVSKKDASGKLVDKVTYAHLSDVGQSLNFGQKYSEGEVEKLAQESLSAVTMAGYGYGNKEIRSFELNEKLKGDSIFVANAVFKNGWNSPENMLHEVYCTLVYAGNLGKAKPVKISYDNDGFCRIRPMIMPIGKKVFTLPASSLIMRLRGITEPAKERFL